MLSWGESLSLQFFLLFRPDIRPRVRNRQYVSGPCGPRAVSRSPSRSALIAPRSYRSQLSAPRSALITGRSVLIPLRANWNILSCHALRRVLNCHWDSPKPRASLRRRRRGHDRSQFQIRAPRSFAGAGPVEPGLRRSRSIVTMKSPVSGPRRCGSPVPGAAGALPRFSRWTR